MALRWRILTRLVDHYPSAIDPQFSVPGIILSAKNHTLYTDSLIADALLGAGDALDCFNQKAQDASTMADYIRNIQAMQRVEDSIQTTANNQLVATQQLAMGAQQIDMGTQRMDIVTQQKDVVDALITAGDAVATASLYKKVFGDCCDVPQNTDNGGCGCA